MHEIVKDHPAKTADYTRLFDEAELRAEAFRAKIIAESNVKATLQTRHNTHGDFYQQSLRSMMLLDMMMGGLTWNKLGCDQQESLILIAVKIGRILTGNQDEPDHWHDIAGYAQLVENRLKGLPSNGEATRNVPPSDKTWFKPPFEGAAGEEASRWDVNYGATPGFSAPGATARDPGR